MKMFAMTILVVSMLSAPLHASEEWLPPAVADGMARQLGERMTQMGIGGRDEDHVLAVARQTVSRMRMHLDAWKLSGVLERAPRFPELALPEGTNQYVDAMTRYSLCNIVLFRLFSDPTTREDPVAMAISTYGLTAVTMAIVRLREPHVREGGTDAMIEAALTGPELEVLAQRIQEDEDVLRHVARQCDPFVRVLLGPAVVEE